MKFLSFLSSILVFTLLFSSCNNKQGGRNGLSSDTLKVGEKPIYSESGKLHYLVEAQTLHASYRVREYTPDGKLYMDAIYKDDHRNGKCTHYYKNGQPFSVAFFINGAKDSIETKYNEKGQVLAFVPYKNGKVQPGLKEFNKDGSELIDNTALQVKAVNQLARGGKYYLKVSLSKPQQDVKFYAAPQSDPDSRELLKISGNEGILEVPVSASGFVIKNIYLDAEYKTSMRNTRRLQKLYKF
jgi:antitoxin component YwqK of YwqJK toxin-antitoxin module